MSNTVERLVDVARKPFTSALLKHEDRHSVGLYSVAFLSQYSLACKLVNRVLYRKLKQTENIVKTKKSFTKTFVCIFCFWYKTVRTLQFPVAVVYFGSRHRETICELYLHFLSPLDA